MFSNTIIFRVFALEAEKWCKEICSQDGILSSYQKFEDSITGRLLSSISDLIFFVLVKIAVLNPIHKYKFDSIVIEMNEST